MPFGLTANSRDCTVDHDTTHVSQKVREPLFRNRSTVSCFAGSRFSQVDSLRLMLVGGLLACVSTAMADTTNDVPPKDSQASAFAVDERPDRLMISLSGKPIVEFVFRDERILRPYFANARLVDGRRVTRQHPPIPGADDLDHDTMHPGIWLGFGDISGHDFWRNKGAIEHVRFTQTPTSSNGCLRFATECRLKTNSGEPFCQLINSYTLAERPNGWLLVWDATFRADERPVAFGDQEEMGFGARVASHWTEKRGGLIRSSSGKTSAKETWGQPAQWCDYSGSGPEAAGVMLMTGPGNFRSSWWHNRDYGVFVANPFGRAAMKQGERSVVTVAPGASLRLTFGALMHDHRELSHDVEYDAFKSLLSE
jgi:hypothetical protein